VQDHGAEGLFRPLTLPPSTSSTFTAHLTERFAAGATDAVALHAELQQLGYTGSVQTVRRHLNPLPGR
jgi:hypothetical protein